MQNSRDDADRPTIRYQESIGAPAFLWFLVVLLSGSLGIAYGAAIGARWGFAIFALIQGLGTWWLLAARTRIVVDDAEFAAGRARLPLEFVGGAHALDPEQARYVAGVGADARAYLQLRGSGRGAVKVDLDDPADPTPYWLVSTRDPVGLRAAILAAKAAAEPTES